MHNFVFHNPVKVIFGKGTISQLGKEIKVLGDSVLLVYGKGSIKKNGIYQQVVNALKASSISYLEHGGVNANPRLSHVHKGIEKARSAGVSVILGVGGGSVIDSAKAIAAGIPIAHDVWKFFTGKKGVKSVLPIVCVPTVAGAGSEMNSGMVLTHDDKGLKFGFGHRYLFPKVCISDPATTLSLSAEQTAYGAVDTITHCLEAYFTTTSVNVPFQFGFLENICRTSFETCSRLLQDPGSYEDRSTMLWTASMALSGIGTAGLGKISFPMHLLEHSVSALLDVPHGAGLAAVIPGFTIYQQTKLRHRLEQFGARVFDIEATDSRRLSARTIDSLQEFLISSGCPVSLKEIGVAQKDLPVLLEHCLNQARIWRMTDYDRDTISGLLDYCYNP